MAGPIRNEFDARVIITNQGITIRPTNQTMFGILYPSDMRKWHQPRPGDAGFNSKVDENIARSIIEAGIAAKENGDRMGDLDEALALEHGISAGTVRAIRLGKRWRWVYHMVHSDMSRSDEYEISENEDSGIAVEDLI